MISLDWEHIVAFIISSLVIWLLKVIGGELKKIVDNLNRMISEWDKFKETITNHEAKLAELLELKEVVVKVEGRMSKIEKILEE
jgi:hypothetical protein